jgi:hypothetical protein
MNQESIPTTPFAIDGMLANPLRPQPVAVIYYGHHIRKKKLAYNNSDLGTLINSLVTEGNKNLEVHIF